ncbi:MAG TPA: ATP-dependent zinc protease [Nitrospiria bacterium]
MTKHPQMIIGWKEWVSLPELRIPAIQAKVDTGAKTSSLHAFNIKRFTRQGNPFVRFELHPIRKNTTITRIREAPLVGKRTVKSSGGEREKRPVIKTRLNINGAEWEIELNLTNRDYMGFRMLIGREALAKKVMINPGVPFIQAKLSDLKAMSLYRRRKRK